jgi:hypothetical protein
LTADRFRNLIAAFYGACGVLAAALLVEPVLRVLKPPAG